MGKMVEEKWGKEMPETKQYKIVSLNRHWVERMKMKRSDWLIKLT
jgi:hypothetical protein